MLLLGVPQVHAFNYTLNDQWTNPSSTQQAAVTFWRRHYKDGVLQSEYSPGWSWIDPGETVYVWTADYLNGDVDVDSFWSIGWDWRDVPQSTTTIRLSSTTTTIYAEYSTTTYRSTTTYQSTTTYNSTTTYQSTTTYISSTTTTVPVTGYKVNGTDLNLLFYGKKNGATAIATNHKMSDGRDINLVLEKRDSASPKGAPTGFKVAGQDLAELFEPFTMCVTITPSTGSTTPANSIEFTADGGATYVWEVVAP